MEPKAHVATFCAYLCIISENMSEGGGGGGEGGRGRGKSGKFGTLGALVSLLVQVQCLEHFQLCL